jgi:hypothetical protein
VKRTEDLLAQRRHVHGQYAGLRSEVGHGGIVRRIYCLANLLANGRSVHGRLVGDSGFFQALGDNSFDRVFMDGFGNFFCNGFCEIIVVDVRGIDFNEVKGGVGESVPNQE